MAWLAPRLNTEDTTKSDPMILWEGSVEWHLDQRDTYMNVGHRATQKIRPRNLIYRDHLLSQMPLISQNPGFLTSARNNIARIDQNLPRQNRHHGLRLSPLSFIANPAKQLPDLLPVGRRFTAHPARSDKQHTKPLSAL